MRFKLAADWGFGWLCALRVIQGVAQAGLYDGMRKPTLIDLYRSEHPLAS